MKRDDASQFSMPLARPVQAVDFDLIRRQPSMAKALQLCQSVSGLDDAQFYGDGGIVKHQAQWSRIMGGRSDHRFPADGINAMMDITANEVPLLWLAHSRGYDIERMHKMESATERENRLLREENTALKRVLLGGAGA